MNACVHCGYQNIDSARFCQSCGQRLSGEGQRRAMSTPNTPTSTEYVGFWWRVLAALIDGAILFIGISLLSTLTDFPPTVVPLSILVPWIYEALLLSSEQQATVGKMAIGSVVTDEAGQPLSFALATARHFAKYVSFPITLGVGYIMVAFTRKKQGLHDLIASTVVVRRPK